MFRNVVLKVLQRMCKIDVVFASFCKISWPEEREK
jgi:hypothetical protein